MSVKIMGAVWDADLPRDEKFILMSYADHASHDGTNVYPSVNYTSWKTGYSRRSVQAITKKLIKRGALLVDGVGPGGTNRYRVNVDALPQRPPFRKEDEPDEGANSAGVQELHGGGANSAPLDTPKGANSAPKPLDIEPLVEPSVILARWGELFPDKIQPRASTFKKKIQARLSDAEFAEGWEGAMREAAKSLHLRRSSWFQLEFFVRNDDNWRKCRDHYYASFDEEIGRQNGNGGNRVKVAPPVMGEF